MSFGRDVRTPELQKAAAGWLVAGGYADVTTNDKAPDVVSWKEALVSGTAHANVSGGKLEVSGRWTPSSSRGWHKSASQSAAMYDRIGHLD